MENEISRLVTQLARIRNVEVGYVYETLKQSIIAGLKRRFGREVRHEVEVEAESGDINIAIIQTAVPKVQDVTQEISMEEAQRLKPDVKEGEDVKIEIPLKEVGRVAIQRTVDELTHRLREAERTKLFNEFIKKKGDIISGTVHKIEKEEVLINLGPIYGILPARDQLKTDHLQIGSPLKFYVLRVDLTPIGPRVYLSRTHPEFLRKLLTREVPEIQQNIVEIKGVARIPGVRSKVAVTSHDEKIDPIGACVGYRKVRIQNVTKELSGEKIDVIPWNSDEKVFIAKAMSPARVNEVVEEEDSFTVVVPDDEFSKAIGRKGQNVWLASLLTSSKLDILKESDYRNRLFSQRMAQIMIETLDFLGPETKETLVESGFTTVVSLYDQPATEVSKVIGWDPTRVEQLKTQIREQLEKRELERKLFGKEKLEEMKASADAIAEEAQAKESTAEEPSAEESPAEPAVGEESSKEQSEEETQETTSEEETTPEEETAPEDQTAPDDEKTQDEEKAQEEEEVAAEEDAPTDESQPDDSQELESEEEDKSKKTAKKKTVKKTAKKKTATKKTATKKKAVSKEKADEQEEKTEDDSSSPSEAENVETPENPEDAVKAEDAEESPSSEAGESDKEDE